MVAVLSIVLTLAAAIPSTAQDNTETYAYDIHYASPPVASVGATPPEPKDFRIMRALQGPAFTLLWQKDEEQTMKNAGFVRHRKMGVLVPEWSLTRSSSAETGWTSLGRTLRYDTFSADLRRGKEDRTLAGSPAKHYIFEAHFTKQVEGNARKQRFDVTSDIWILADHPFSWAPFEVFGTQSVNADPRLQAALAERLVEKGMVARAETELSFKLLGEDGDSSGGSGSRQIVWIDNLKQGEAPQVDMPLISSEAGRALNTEIEKNPRAFCKAVLAGTTPGFVQEVLSDSQQSAFLGYAESQCK